MTLKRSNPIKCGYLTKSPPLDKKSILGFGNSWCRRWFELRSQEQEHSENENTKELLYFKNKGDSKPKGTILIDPRTEIVNRTDAVSENPNIIDIVTPERTYHLSAETINEKLDWLDALTITSEEYKQTLTRQDSLLEFLNTSGESRGSYVDHDNSLQKELDQLKSQNYGPPPSETNVTCVDPHHYVNYMPASAQAQSQMRASRSSAHFSQSYNINP